MEWLADRFFRSRGRWIDASSGTEVKILIEDAAPFGMADWEEQCARIARIRHPLLNPLLDYGELPGSRRFEAYTPAESTLRVHDPRKTRQSLTQFLRASGVTIDGEREKYVLREQRRSAGPSRRLLGVTLQPRRALDALREVLHAPPSAPLVATVVGPAAAGLRTLRIFVARCARMAGFVPVSPGVLVHRFATGSPSQRHFCVLDDEIGSAREFAGALVRLGAESARQHVVIRFRRLGGARSAIPLDPLSIRSLIGMVFAGSDDGPTEEEMFRAARFADGRPGAFLAQLTALEGMPMRSSFLVHETPQDYVVDREGPAMRAPAEPTGRTLQTALRARDRAIALAQRGRHAAALRLLQRASRVLAGRGRSEEAAACVLEAGELARERGSTSEAVRLFEEARGLSATGPRALEAAIALGQAWIDDLRLIEAEAVLRGALAGAEAVHDGASTVVATAALVRCLNAQDHAAEAIAVAAALDWTEQDRGAVPLLAALSQSHAALGRTATAIRLARRAESLLGAGTADAACRSEAGLAIAEALASAGDTTGMQQALGRVREVARAAHRPLPLVSAALIEAEHAQNDSNHSRQRRVRHLRSFMRIKLPKLYRARVEAVLKVVASTDRSVAGKLEAARKEDDSMRTLEAFLQTCHQASDDRAALAAICAAALERLRAAAVTIVSRDDYRVLASGGRPWSAGTTLVAQAIAASSPCSSSPGVEPRETAEPVRHGTEIVGAIACRWTVGAPMDPDVSADVLRAAALAAAAPVRALLDSTVPAPPEGAWGDLLGSSPSALAVRDAVLRAARAPFPVLIEGESGSGKELVARAIHRLSARRERRFCAVNCAALTDELVEAELFGHARGAFTGAATERQGLFEEADGGTLFLDEVAELSARAQAKLLRVLQEGEVRRVGENFPRRVDVRIVAATNRRLEEEVPAGRFRADLRFRLDVIRIVVPPLRERPGDVPVLAAHFWNDATLRVGSRATLGGEALATLSRYDWPGNVRELQNVIAWIAVHSPRRGRIGASALPAHVAQSAAPAARTFAAAREDFERRFVRAALAGADGQMTRAARALGMSRQGLSKMMRRLRIEQPGML